jgi:hypothetical protein
MKTKELWHKDYKNEKIIIEKEWDVSPTIERMNQIKSAGLGDGKDYKLAGSIPIGLLKTICDKLGVNWNDVDARKDVVKKMLLSGDFDKLRAWKGKF